MLVIKIVRNPDRKTRGWWINTGSEEKPIRFGEVPDTMDWAVLLRHIADNLDAIAERNRVRLGRPEKPKPTRVEGEVLREFSVGRRRR